MRPYSWRAGSRRIRLSPSVGLPPRPRTRAGRSSGSLANHIPCTAGSSGPRLFEIAMHPPPVRWRLACKSELRLRPSHVKQYTSFPRSRPESEVCSAPFCAPVAPRKLGPLPSRHSATLRVCRHPRHYLRDACATGAAGRRMPVPFREGTFCSLRIFRLTIGAA
jgi:hypothetical protein